VYLWIGFSCSMVILLLVARRSLSLAMALAAAILAAFTLSPSGMGGALRQTFLDPSVLLLALIVAMIPLIGGVMESSGQMDRLVANLRIGVRPFLAFAPALLGMLPMPGGALLSAPLVERGAGHAPGDVKTVANVWFRHALLLVYPLGPALIASAKIAQLEVYAVIPFLAPAFFLCLAAGYVFLLRKVSGRLSRAEAFSLAGLVVPLFVILVAPLLDLLLQGTGWFSIMEIGTTLGVATSLGIAMWVGRVRPSAFRKVVRKAKPWKYSLIIFAMFAFLNVFAASGAPERIAGMALDPMILCIGIGFILGLVTGRIQAPMSIIVPIYISTYGALSAPAFAVTYFAVFLGYILTPVHPCISVSVEYFHTTMGAFLRRIAAPAAVGLVATCIAGLFLL